MLSGLDEGRVSARQRRKLFTVWTCDAVEALMKRRDIILRAFRGTGVGIDVEGKERGIIRFPGFETYVLPEKDEEHNDDPITEAEVNELTKDEREFQKKKRRESKTKRNCTSKACEEETSRNEKNHY